MASNGANDSMAKGSCIITPFGYVINDDLKKIINYKANFDDITKVRKFMNIGL